MSVWVHWTDEQWLSNPPPPATWSAGAADWKRRVDFMQRRIRGELAPSRYGSSRFGLRAVRPPSPKVTPAKAPATRAVQPPPKPGNFGPGAYYSQALGWVTPARDKQEVQSMVNAERNRQELEARKARKRREKAARKEARARWAPWLEEARRGGPPPPIATPAAVAPRRSDSGTTVPALRSAGPGGKVTAVREPATYGPHGDFSWIRDRYLDVAYRFGLVPTAGTRSGEEPFKVRERLLRHQREMVAVATQGTDEERALIRGYFAEKDRFWQGTISDRGAENFRAFIAGEFRDDSTATGSLGQFVPPVYLLTGWQMWRTAAAPVASQAGQRQLPATGMKVTVPAFTSAFTISEQATQNATLAASTPTATYRSANVLTLGGSVTMSQQLLDRAGVNIDTVLAEQGARQAGTTLDAKCIAAILAGLPTGNKISNTATTPSIGALWADVAKGSMLTRTTEGTRLAPDALMIPPANLTWFQAQVDTDKRPIWLPTAGAAGSRNVSSGPAEGYSGYDILGARVFTDASTELISGTDAVLLLGNFQRGLLVYSAAPIIDVFPETQAKSLSVVVTFRQYAALVVAYPGGFVSITSTTGAYPKSPTFTGA